MSFSERARQSSPLKWQLLTVFTLAESVLLGFITSLYRPQTVLSAMSSTAIATLSITLYTLMNKSPKYDLSQWGAGLSSMGMTFLVYGVLDLLSRAGILPQFLPYNESIFCMFGSALFSMYLAYHTRLIVGGKHSKYQLNEKDYVFGALLLYQDIVSLFLYILRLLNDDGGD
jgi:FtsH-binding integral membrane protein